MIPQCWDASACAPHAPVQRSSSSESSEASEPEDDAEVQEGGGEGGSALRVLFVDSGGPRIPQSLLSPLSTLSKPVRK